MRFTRWFVALALLFAFIPTGAGASSSTLSCSNPKVLTSKQGGIDFPPYRVNQEVWTGEGKQTMYVCSASSWKAVATQSGAPATGVKTYPHTELRWTDWSRCASQPKISSFTKLQNTYGFIFPKAGSWDAATDIFTDGHVCGRQNTEIMVIHQWRNVDFPNPQDKNVTIAGIVYNAYHSGGFVQLYQVTRTNKGTFDLLAVLKWCQSKGYLRAAATIAFDREGVEILTTGGQPVPFELNAFAIAAAH